ncbi:hypothetical protein [Bradyrhizobium sp. ORS 285]|uniref:hypothetical protein n=1 Tax=Bradyrhizobium sp. ORS 285 TaxID=115808 RepID=UPI001FCE0150|nr:hypothetical protein [Bradyrhizobium sp. ORS 285]
MTHSRASGRPCVEPWSLSVTAGFENLLPVILAKQSQLPIVHPGQQIAQQLAGEPVGVTEMLRWQSS